MPRLVHVTNGLPRLVHACDQSYVTLLRYCCYADVTGMCLVCCLLTGKYNAPLPGDEKIKSRGKRRQFDSVTDFGKERTKVGWML